MLRLFHEIAGQKAQATGLNPPWQLFVQNTMETMEPMVRTLLGILQKLKQQDQAAAKMQSQSQPALLGDPVALMS